MTISVGERLPDVKFKTMSSDGPAELSTADVFAGKKVVLFAVPGAFTPTCHLNHLPGFLEQYDTIKSRGVDEIAVVSVNDVWVMHAWAENTRAKGKILFLADGGATFTKAVGLDNDLTIAGMGLRSKRYSMLVEDGVVRQLNVEEARGVDVSGAATILEQL
ncbi:MAG: peroxiredoxin [Pseudomonadota bacterium]|nr:peroxiredoxin [Pseudomonadota bacterium]